MQRCLLFNSRFHIVLIKRHGDIPKSYLVLLCLRQDMLFRHHSRLCPVMNLVSYLAFNYSYCYFILVRLLILLLYSCPTFFTKSSQLQQLQKIGTKASIAFLHRGIGQQLRWLS